MTLDDLVLGLQHLLDRLVRRARLGRAPEAGGRRLLIVQIDGLSQGALEQALAAGFMPFLKRLLDKGMFTMQPMAVGLPTSTPAFQMAAMYGVQPDIPGFHYHDKRRREDVHFPRAGDAAFVEEQAAGRVGIVTGGSTYGCVFTGGAPNNLFSFSQIKRPSGKGILRVLSALVVLLWVIVKSVVFSVFELVRALLRFVADPVGESRRGWKWLAIKIGISVWLRELFTLAVSRDLYMGVPAVYVNYLDYDVIAHVYGPRHRRALRSLRHVDRSLHQLWRVCRRVPGYGYDLHVLSDHGQAHCTPYIELMGGTPIERRLFDEFFDPAHADATPTRRRRRPLASGMTAFRSGHAPGVLQRFLNYLEDPGDFGELKEARERNGVRVIASGPNAFVYFVDDPQPLVLDQIDERFPGLARDLSRSRGIGFVLARTPEGPVCFWRGKRYGLDELAAGPFAGREDPDIVRDGIRDLMAMPSAGDLVLYGLDSAEGNVSFIAEIGAHAGTTFDELHTFIIAPRGVRLPTPIVHPLQLYPYFVQYQGARRNAV